MAHSRVLAAGRELTEKERTLVERLLPNASTFLPQLSHLRVVSRCSCGCPTVGFGVSGRAAALTTESTILGEGGGVSPEGVRFAVILHCRDGLISELEVYPLMGDAPFSLPEIDQIEIYDS